MNGHKKSAVIVSMGAGAPLPFPIAKPGRRLCCDIFKIHTGKYRMQPPCGFFCLHIVIRTKNVQFSGFARSPGAILVTVPGFIGRCFPDALPLLSVATGAGRSSPDSHSSKASSLLSSINRFASSSSPGA
jgi:hypothetical protein